MSVQIGEPTETLSDERWDLISRQVRANMGLGRDKFARLLRVTPRTVMRWENITEDDRVIPQGIQRMKLLALCLDASAPERQQELLNELLEEATDFRAQYERKATTIRRYALELGVEPPAWFEDLLRLKNEKNWSALALMGPHFLPREQNRPSGLHPQLEAMVYLWVGIASFMQGLPLKAIHFYDQGLASGELPALMRCVLLSNKGLAQVRVRQFEDAVQSLDACLNVDSAHRGALRNKLVLYAQTGEEAAAREAARQLLAYYPEANDPTAELGQCIATDPDLSPFRATSAFREIFTRLNA